MDIKKVLRNLARVGIVSSVNPADMTARVTFPDRDNLVSADLHIITTGSQDTKVYWLPYVGEQVVCLFSANDNNLTEGYILGTMYNSKDTPPATGQGVRAVKFADGSTVINDNGNITVNATGSVTINAPTVTINGGSGDVVVDGVSLVNHTHGGIIPGGGSTAPPNK